MSIKSFIKSNIKTIIVFLLGSLILFAGAILNILAGSQLGNILSIVGGIILFITLNIIAIRIRKRHMVASLVIMLLLTIWLIGYVGLDVYYLLKR